MKTLCAKHSVSDCGPCDVDFVERATVPDLASLFRKAKDAGLIQPQAAYSYPNRVA